MPHDLSAAHGRDGGVREQLREEARIRGIGAAEAIGEHEKRNQLSPLERGFDGRDNLGAQLPETFALLIIEAVPADREGREVLGRFAGESLLAGRGQSFVARGRRDPRDDAARQDGGGKRFGPGRREDPPQVAARLFERFEQRIGRLQAEKLRLRNDRHPARCFVRPAGAEKNGLTNPVDPNLNAFRRHPHQIRMKRREGPAAGRALSARVVAGAEKPGRETAGLHLQARRVGTRQQESSRKPVGVRGETLENRGRGQRENRSAMCRQVSWKTCSGGGPAAMTRTRSGSRCAMAR